MPSIKKKIVIKPKTPEQLAEIEQGKLRQSWLDYFNTDLAPAIAKGDCDLALVELIAKAVERYAGLANDEQWNDFGNRINAITKRVRLDQVEDKLPEPDVNPPAPDPWPSVAQAPQVPTTAKDIAEMGGDERQIRQALRHEYPSWTTKRIATVAAKMHADHINKRSMSVTHRVPTPTVMSNQTNSYTCKVDGCGGVFGSFTERDQHQRTMHYDKLVVGPYFLNGEGYQVKKSNTTGNLYAKRLIWGPNREPMFEFDKGAVFKLDLRHRMTLAQATQLGTTFGVCVNCGRTLTDPKSVAASMGPICRKRYMP
jgi:hypothetical protein